MIDDARLRSAVEELYEAFAGRPLREWTEPCLHCCATVESEAALHAAPLRELSFDVIREYSLSAMTTWGDEREFTHFLPRIFEILATQDFNWPDIEVLFGNLRRADWRSWPSREQVAVEHYLMAKWLDTLAHDDPVQDVEDVLCAIGQAVDDLGPYLQAWEDAGERSAASHLVKFVLWSWRPMKGRLSDAFWEDRQAQAEQVVAWLKTARVAERLTELATAPSDDRSDEAALALQAVTAA